MSTFTIVLAPTIVGILNTIIPLYKLNCFTLSLTTKLIYQDNIYYLE